MEPVNNETTHRPKVLIFSMGFDPFIGGAEIAITELTKRLADRYEFHIVTCRIRRELPRFEDKGYIKIYRVGTSLPGADNDEFSKWPLKINKWLFPFLAYAKGTQLHLKHRFNAHWCMLAFTGAIGSLLFKLTFPKVSYLLDLQDGRTYEERKATFGRIFPIIRKSFQKTDIIKGLGSFHKTVAEKMGATAPFVRIPNGVDVSIFTKSISDTEQATLRSTLQLNPATTYLISTTRLVARRGHEALIGSLAHLPDSYHLILCGSGPHETTLRELATTLGVTERIIWAGDVAYKDIPRYLSVADIFVRPSVYEGMGNSFIEAFAAGIPVVGTPVGGIVDFLFDDERNPHPKGYTTGFIATVDDPEDLATQIKRVSASNADTAARVKNARALTLSEYDWDVVAARMHEEIFTPMLAGD